MRRARKVHPLVRFALLFCPREFRERYAFEIYCDAADEHPATTAMDALRSGIAMRIEDAARNVRIALRSLGKSPLFTVVSILSIALAIGVNVAIGTVIEGIILRPLPYANPSQLVFLSEVVPNFGTYGMTYPGTLALKNQSHTVSDASVSFGTEGIIRSQGGASTIEGRVVDASYFNILGVHPELGRFFERRDLGTQIAIISDALWRRSFGGDASVIGRRLRVKDVFKTQDFTIVGVAPTAFRDPTVRKFQDNDYWTIVDPHSKRYGDNRYPDTVIARLRPGVTLAAASADLNTIVHDIAVRHEGAEGKPIGGAVLPLARALIGPVQPLLWMLYLAVAAILLIACVNVANLQLTRAATRQSELVVRSAVGASRKRIVSHVLTESALIAGAGGIAAMLLGWLSLQLFSAFGSAFLPRWENVHVDIWIVLYAAVLVSIATILTGLPSGLMRTAKDLSAGLRSAGRSEDESRVAKRLRFGLVVAEVSLAVSLVIAAGIVLRSFITLTHADVGFSPENVYVVAFDPITPAKRNELIQQLAAIPGVRSLAGADDVPFSPFGSNATSVTLPEKPHLESGMIEFIDVTPGFFRTLQIPLRYGRDFTARDKADSAPVAIVNDSFARRFFGTANVVGRRIAPASWVGPSKTPPLRTIVGVVGDTRNSFALRPAPQMYAPVSQIDEGAAQIVIRTDGPVSDLQGAIRKVFAVHAATIPPPKILPFLDLFARDTIQARADTALFGALAVIALLLALAGIYSVSSYASQRRTHEFGVRKALGARAPDILRSVLWGALRQSAIGIALGLIVAAVCMPALTSLLYNVSPLDPLTFALVMCLAIVCTVTAAILPAMRATRVDPSTALRYE